MTSATFTSSEQTRPRPRKSRLLWGIFGLSILLLGRFFVAGRYVSATLALVVWLGAEFAHSRGINPLIGPWAKKGSARAQILHLLWPMWRIGFMLNVGIIFWFVHILTGNQWVALATLSPWIIFTTLGLSSAILHNLAGTPDNAERWIMRARHLMYLVIGFGPFGMCCICGTFLVPFIRLFSHGNHVLIQRRTRVMGQMVFRGILRYLEAIGFIRVRFKDVSNYQGGARLIVGNHISMFDIISMLAYVDQCGTFVKSNYAYMPIMRHVIKACGFIPIDPLSHESRQAGMQRARDALLRGETIVVWPEGTRSKDGSLGEFHNGVFRLALEAQVNITPAVFTSSSPVFNNLGALRETDGTVTFRVSLEPEIAVDRGVRITPGRVLITRDRIRNFFLERLTHDDVPAWMQLKAQKVNVPTEVEP